MVSDPERKHPPHVRWRSSSRFATAQLQVLLWERALEPFAGAWSLPGGYLEPTRRSRSRSAGTSRRRSTSRALAPRAARDAQRPRPQPARWQLATAYLGLVPSDVDPALPPTRAGTPSTSCRARLRPRRDRARGPRAAPGEALVHERRLRARPGRRSRSRELRELYAAALGHDVSATNLQRVLRPPSCSCRPAGAASQGGRAAGPRRSSASARRELEVTDQFAVLRPPLKLET